MTFKDSLANDISKVFINTLEFADTHTINNVQIDCIVDKNITEESKSRASTYDREGVFVRQILIYVKKEDIDKPVEGERLTLDGELYLVNNVAENDGLLEITLERNDY